MSTYYEFKGSLTFPSATAAHAAFETMIGNDESIYYLPPGIERKSKTLQVEGDTLVFNSAGFAGAEPFYTTQSLVKQVVGGAIAGRVRSQEGDGGPGSYVEYYGFKPRRTPAAAKKPAAKKTAAKKPAAKKPAAKKPAAKKPAAKKPAAKKPAAKKPAAKKPVAKKKR